MLRMLLVIVTSIKSYSYNVETPNLLSVSCLILSLSVETEESCLCLLEKSLEFLHGPGPVRYLVFDFLSQLGEALVVAVGNEQGVITETLGAMLLGVDTSGHHTLEQMLAVGVAIGQQQRDDRAETGLAVGGIAQLTQQLSHIGLAVVVGALGIAGRVYARRTIQGLDLQAGVVGKAAEVVVVEHILCLLVGILLQRAAGLGDVGMTADVVERHNLEVASEYITNLLQLMLVVGGEDDFHDYVI